jgi:hypothetical protein
LEPDHKLKNVSRLLGWFTLPALERIQRNLDNPDSISFVWRGGGGGGEEQQQAAFRLMMQNANDCVNMVVKALKRQAGATVHKNY